MKKTWILVFMVMSVGKALPQDTLILNESDRLTGKVIEINPGIIVLQNTDSLGETNRTLMKSSVAIAKYGNGSVDLFPQSPEQMFEKGRKDAHLYYNNIEDITGPLVGTMMLPPIGVLITYSASYDPVYIDKEQVSDPAFLYDKNYYEGYQKQARRIKKRKAMKYFNIGAIPWVIVAGIMISR